MKRLPGFRLWALGFGLGARRALRCRKATHKRNERKTGPSTRGSIVTGQKPTAKSLKPTVNRRFLAALALANALVGGCARGSDPGTPATGRVSEETPATALGPDATTGGIAAHEHEVGGVLVVLTELVRTGDTVTARWTYSNATQEARTLAGGEDADSVPYLLTAGAYLLDAEHEKKYLVVHDAQGRPVTSRHGGPYDVVLEPGATIEAWAKFPAPSPPVQTMTLYVPGVPLFEDVRITE